MKSRIILASFIGIIQLLITASAFAVDLKLGFVNAARVLEEAPQAELARKQLEKEFAPRDKEIVEMQKSLKKLEEKLSKDALIMSESNKDKLEREILTRKRELKRSKEEFREDLNIRRNEAFERLRKRVFQVIVAIAKDEKFDLIVSDGVVFASDRIDITNVVVERLNKEMKNKRATKK